MFLILEYSATGYRTAGRCDTFEDAVKVAKRVAQRGNGVSIRFVRSGEHE